MLQDKTAGLLDEFNSSLAEVKSEESLNTFRIAWVGKEGKLKVLLSSLRDLPAEERPKFAAQINLLRDQAESFIRQKQEEFSALARQRELESQFIDLTLPANYSGLGRVHPVRLVERKITKILKKFGFNFVEGPEVETEYYCFDALNIPKHHPARDMQDTFFTETGHVLRTHTTAMLSRELEKRKLPLKSIYAGRVYRNETEDASHQAMFHQYDLVWIEEGIGLPQLIAVMTSLLKGIYGQGRQVRFVPKFYPYTEPSLGAQIDCSICQGKGCPPCDGAGWVTVAGSGVVHENVIKEFGFDPTLVGGIAFGFGTSRMAGQFYTAPNLKSLYEADLRYLGAL
jgi:phenylalanyl-tRNA synthetase alpha chain